MTIPSHVDPEALGVSTQRLERYRNVMQALIDDGRLAGLSTLVARGSEVVAFDTFGVLDVAHRRATPADAIYNLASMTKPVTGVAMMTLFEEGAWDLRDPVTTILPELDGLTVLGDEGSLVPAARPPTMGELMSHTGGFSYGLFDEPIDGLYREANLLDRNSDLQSLVAKVAALPLAFQPGTGCRYSISVDLQAACAERLTGHAFADVLVERVLEPLQMRETGYFVTADDLARLAKIHTYAPDGELTVLPPAATPGGSDPTSPPTLHSGGGGLYSTMDDCWRFAAMLRNRGEYDGVRILSPRTVDLMRTNRLPTGLRMAAIGPYDFAGEGFGLDLSVIIEPARSMMPLAGAGTYYWAGAFGTWFWIDPANDVTFIGMMQQLPGVDPDGRPIPRPDVIALSSTLTYQSLVG